MKPDSPETLPDGFRVRAYATVELLLDLVYVARQIGEFDLDSVLIYYCVSEATMRPLVLGPDTPPDVMAMPEPPEEMRGSISRLLVADRVGMPRETVRRKIGGLIAAGLIIEDGEGRVRTPRNLAQASVQQSVAAATAAVQRYHARLRQLGASDDSGP